MNSDELKEYRGSSTTFGYVIELERRNARLVAALKEIAELGDVRADEAGWIARRALDETS